MGLTDMCIRHTASDQHSVGRERAVRRTRHQALWVTEATRHSSRSHLRTYSQPASSARWLHELGRVP